MYNCTLFLKPICRKFNAGSVNILNFTRKLTFVKHEYTFQYWVLSKLGSSKKYLTWDFRNDFPASKSLDAKSLSVMKPREIIDALWAKKETDYLTTQIINIVDHELGRRLLKGDITTNDVLPLLHGFALAVPTRVASSALFKNAIVFLIKKPPLLTHHKIQTMYYASFAKNCKKSKQLIQLLNKQLTLGQLTAFSTEELGIYCISLFQSSIQITDKNVLVYLGEKIKVNLSEMIKDTFYFISFIKCLRYSKFYDDQLFLAIADLPFHIFEEINLVARIHLTIYYSDAKYNDVIFMKKLLSLSIREIDYKIKSGEPVRIKDIDNILWSASQYSLIPITEEINNSVILRYIFKLAETDPRSDLITVLHTLLSLCILNYGNKEDIMSYLIKQRININKVSENFKDISRISMLLSCCNIEGGKDNNNTFRIIKRQEPTMSQHLSMRPKVAQVLIFLRHNGYKFSLRDVCFSYPIPCLYIASVSVIHEKGPINVEVVDEYACLRNSSILNGSMKLKLRLLEKLGIYTFKINLAEQEPTHDFLNKEFRSFFNEFSKV